MCLWPFAALAVLPFVLLVLFFVAPVHSRAETILAADCGGHPDLVSRVSILRCIPIAKELL